MISVALLSAGIFTLAAIIVTRPLDADGDLYHINTAKTELRFLKSALEAYRRDHGRYPTTKEGLAVLAVSGAYIEYLSTDPWNQPYLYRSLGTKAQAYDFYSTGPNKIDERGVGDDIRPEP